MASVEFDHGSEYALPLAKLRRDITIIDADLDGTAQIGERLTAPSVRPEIVALDRRGIAVEADLTERSAGDRSSVRSRNQPRLTSSEIRGEAKTLREQVAWNLREEGYRYREIADLLRITKQRVSQIERQLILRAIASKSKRDHLLGGHPKAVQWKAKWRVRRVTIDDFARRLDALNGYYEPQLQHILKRGYNRQRFRTRAKSPVPTLFWKVWPLIELYGLKPFSFSRLIGDFPSLAQQPYLPQLLSRLRRRGLLRKVGSVRIEGHNLPEILMAQTPIEEYVAPKIEKLVAKWIRKLEQLQSTYRPNRPDCSIQSIRKYLIQTLMEEGHSALEIERVLRTKLNRRSGRYERLHLDSGSADPLLGQLVDNRVA